MNHVFAVLTLTRTSDNTKQDEGSFQGSYTEDCDEAQKEEESADVQAHSGGDVPRLSDLSQETSQSLRQLRHRVSWHTPNISFILFLVCVVVYL